MRFKELKSMPRQELEKKLEEARIELVKLRSQSRSGVGLQNTKKIRNTKRLIARILTILNSKGGE